MPNSRLALHGSAPPLIHGLCTFFASNLHGLCAFFRPLFTPVSTAPFFASLSVHGLRFTVCAPSNQGWPFALPGGCGAEVRKLPQWLLMLRCLAFLRDAEIGHLPGGFKYSGGRTVPTKGLFKENAPFIFLI